MTSNLDFTDQNPLSESLNQLVLDLESDDSPAFEQLWKQMYQTLHKFVQTKLAPQLKPHTGASDILQSAFTSLWKRLENKEKPQCKDPDNLWGLLITITQRKISHRMRAMQTQKRGEGKVITATDFMNSERKQTFDEIAVSQVQKQITEELEELATRIDLESQTIVSMKLMGMTNEEIANTLGCSLRRIERKKSLIRKAFESTQSG